MASQNHECLARRERKRQNLVSLSNACKDVHGAYMRSADNRMWVDIYEPQNEGELAVHVRKVEDVRRWLNEAFEGGPSGKLKKYRVSLYCTKVCIRSHTTSPRSENFGNDRTCWDRKDLHTQGPISGNGI